MTRNEPAGVGSRTRLLPRIQVMSPCYHFALASFAFFVFPKAYTFVKPLLPTAAVWLGMASWLARTRWYVSAVACAHDSDVESRCSF